MRTSEYHMEEKENIIHFIEKIGRNVIGWHLTQFYDLKLCEVNKLAFLLEILKLPPFLIINK